MGGLKPILHKVTSYRLKSPLIGGTGGGSATTNVALHRAHVYSARSRTNIFRLFCDTFIVELFLKTE